MSSAALTPSTYRQRTGRDADRHGLRLDRAHVERQRGLASRRRGDAEALVSGKVERPRDLDLAASVTTVPGASRTSTATALRAVTLIVQRVRLYRSRVKTLSAAPPALPGANTPTELRARSE